MKPIRRIVTNVHTTDAHQSERFYTEVLGFVKAMDLGWIMTFVAPDDPTTQISVLTTDPSGLHPNLSIEVADVDAVHQAAVAQSQPIVYPLTDEPWGVRRFFLRDPNGVIINIVSHRSS
jgi:catechol 2,3-dioxygenase-like lactoylglutathione lyase family enzyme